jgi:hypothetical protein
LFRSLNVLVTLVNGGDSMGAVGPESVDMLGDYDGVRASFDDTLALFAPGWAVRQVDHCASDLIQSVAIAGAIERARARQLSTAAFRWRIAIAEGCWGGGRGLLACASAALLSAAAAAATRRRWHNDLVVLVKVPYRQRMMTFGPPDEPLNEGERTALNDLRGVFTADTSIGVLVLEPWLFPGGGGWLTPAVYREVRTMCTTLGIAIVMDEVGAACRTGRFLAHKWLVPDDNEPGAHKLWPDAVVMGKGLLAAALLLPNEPMEATMITYEDNVTSGGPSQELVRGEQVLRHMLDTSMLNLPRQRALHDACAAEAERQRNTRTAQNEQLVVWGTGSVWYRSRPPKASPNALWLESAHHWRLVLPIDTMPDSAAQWLR